MDEEHTGQSSIELANITGERISDDQIAQKRNDERDEMQGINANEAFDDERLEGD